MDLSLFVHKLRPTVRRLTYECSKYLLSVLLWLNAEGVLKGGALVIIIIIIPTLPHPFHWGSSGASYYHTGLISMILLHRCIKTKTTINNGS